MHRIYLVQHGEQWVTVHTDPEVKELFGTNTLPTPYNSSVDRHFVMAELIKANPDREVIYRG